MNNRRDLIKVNSRLLDHLILIGYNISNITLEVMIEKCFLDEESIYLAIKNKINSSQIAFIHFDHINKEENECIIKAIIVENHNINKNIATLIYESVKKIVYLKKRKNDLNYNIKKNDHKKYEYFSYNISTSKYDGKLRFNI